MRTKIITLADSIRTIRSFFTMSIFTLSGFSFSAWAQTEAADVQIDRIDAWIAQAAKEGNHKAVTGLQRDRATWVQVKDALAHDDVVTLLALQHAMVAPYPYVPSGVGADVQPIERSDANGPEFMHQVYAMPSSGKFQPLEKHEASRSSSGGGYGGFGGRTASIKIPGDASNVRFEKGQHRFVVKVYPGQDPMDIVKLVRFEIRGAKKDRYADLSKSSYAWYHSSTNEVTANRVRIVFESIGDQVYEIIIEGELGPGEFGFMANEKVFAFGVNE